MRRIGAAIVVAVVLAAVLVPASAYVMRRRTTTMAGGGVACSGSQGHTAITANQISATAGEHNVVQWLAGCTGTSTDLCMRFDNSDPDNNYLVYLVVYADNGSDAPGTRTAYEEVSVTSDSDADLEEVCATTIHVSVVSGTKYWIGWENSNFIVKARQSGDGSTRADRDPGDYQTPVTPFGTPGATGGANHTAYFKF